MPLHHDQSTGLKTWIAETVKGNQLLKQWKGMKNKQKNTTLVKNKKPTNKLMIIYKIMCIFNLLTPQQRLENEINVAYLE